MDCTAVAENLVAYHVGAIEDADRNAIEEHLVGCRACLETYLAIKRTADRAVFQRPRPEVRERLRAEVQKAFPPSANSRSKSRTPIAFLRRRIPLYQGVVLAAAAVLLALAGPSIVKRVQRAKNHDAAPMVDTSRTRAESLTIY